jgi:transcriptional/translational regulatory protein YebC/TACO1
VLEESGVEIESAELTMEPKSVVDVDSESDARALLKLIEELDDHDDVESVNANFDIPEALLEQAAA